jgi:hypothetical protein
VAVSSLLRAKICKEEKNEEENEDDKDDDSGIMRKGRKLTTRSCWSQAARLAVCLELGLCPCRTCARQSTHF